MNENCNLFQKSPDIGLKEVEPNLFNDNSYVFQINTVNSLLNSNDYDGAIIAAKNAIQIDSDKPDAFFLIGNAYYQKEMYRQALKSYVIAIEMDFNNPLYHYKAGLVLYQLEEYEYAIMSFDKAIEKDNSLSNAFYMRSMANQRIDRLENSIDDLSSAIKYDTENAEYYFERGYAYHQLACKNYMKLDFYDNAVKDYSRAIELNHENLSEIHLNRGEVYLRLEQYENALNDYHFVLDTHPEWYQAAYERGLAYYHLKKYSLAIRDMKNAIKIYPECSNAYYYLGLSLFFNRKKSKAKQMLEEAEQRGVNEAFLSLLEIENNREPVIENYLKHKIVIRSYDEETAYMENLICSQCKSEKKHETCRIFFVYLNNIPIDMVISQCQICGHYKVLAFDVSCITNNSSEN